jgi:hypothetical protein
MWRKRAPRKGRPLNAPARRDQASFSHALRRVVHTDRTGHARSQHEAGDYVRWFVEHAFVLVPAQSLVAQHLESFKQFPPRQKPGSFSVEQAMEKLRNPPSSN